MPNNTWIISDTHFFHKKIITYCKRPYATADEMDAALIKNWNDRVLPNDTVIHCGDFAFSEEDPSRTQAVFDALNGRKILVVGNHDDKTIKKLGWQSVHEILDFKDNHKRYIFFHYPIERWNRMEHGSVHYHGHTHNSPLPTIENRVNVAVEMIGYAPVLLGWSGMGVI